MGKKLTQSHWGPKKTLQLTMQDSKLPQMPEGLCSEPHKAAE